MNSYLLNIEAHGTAKLKIKTSKSQNHKEIHIPITSPLANIALSVQQSVPQTTNSPPQ